MSDLEAQVAAAYAHFDGPPPKILGVCLDCCMSPEYQDEMMGAQASDISDAALEDWFFAAALDPMPEDVRRWLIPRVLDALLRDAGLPPVGTEVTLDRFRPGDSAFWPAADHARLAQFQRDFLRRALGAAPRLDDTLCMFVLGGYAMGDLADQLMAAPTAILARKLHSDWCARGGHPFWETTFWRDHPGAGSFYRSARLCDHLFAHAVRPGADAAEEAMEVAELILDYGGGR
ncbi:MAG: hypothetical protein AAGF60_06890 [Pseudomonadota bacterium]